jgi:hypothetical protein
MINKIQKLEKWLFDKGFKTESILVAENFKLAMSRPLPINRADVVDIVDELLGELGAKMLAYGFSPLDVLGIITGQVGVSRDVANALAVKATRRKEDVSGNRILVTYMILFSDNPGLPPGQTGWDKDNNEKTVILGFNPNISLQEFAMKEVGSNLSSISNITGDFNKEFGIFQRAIKGYLIETLRHEEVHVIDLMSKPPRVGEKYEVLDPNGETIEAIAKKLQVDSRGFLSQNMDAIVREPSIGVTPDRFMRALNGLLSGDSSAIESLYRSIKNKPLPQGFILMIPNRAQSQTLSYEGETLKAISEKENVPIERLLVVNYNNLFADRTGTGPSPTYQQIYSLPQYIKNSLINMELDPESEVKMIPSYNELYSYDRGFYLLTREEGKAHYEQIIFQIEEATKHMSKEDIGRLSFQEMLDMSFLAKDYKNHLEVKPVDKIIKTPIYGKTLDRLKEERYKKFLNRMYYHWDTNIKLEDSPESVDSV